LNNKTVFVSSLKYFHDLKSRKINFRVGMAGGLGYILFRADSGRLFEMGTGKVQTDKIPEIIEEFDAFKRRIWPIMGGDDTLFDHFIRARKRMEQLADLGIPAGGRMAVPRLGIARNNTALAKAFAAGYGMDESGYVKHLRYLSPEIVKESALRPICLAVQMSSFGL
jgi:hypothetical protein